MAEIEITEANFEAEVLKSDTPVLIDFWAEWCGPCKILSPTVEELANEYSGKLKVGKINVDEQGDLAMRYNVMSIPTLKFFKSGDIVGELVGAAPKSAIEAEIKKHI
jgi:thioredoxin 1